MTDSIWDDSRITSYVLGELPDEERGSFEKEMSDNASLKAAVEEARGVTDRIGDLFDNEATLQLDSSHRAMILEGARMPDIAQPLTDAPQVSLAEKEFGAPSWGVPVIATAIAASLILLIGIAPWLRQDTAITAVVPTIESVEMLAPAADGAAMPAASNLAPSKQTPQPKGPSADKRSSAKRSPDDSSKNDSIQLVNPNAGIDAGNAIRQSESLAGQQIDSEMLQDEVLQDREADVSVAMSQQASSMQLQASSDAPRSPIPTAKSLGLPDVEALAMDNAPARTAGRREIQADQPPAMNESKKRRTVQSLEKVDAPKQRLSRGMGRSRSAEAKSSDVALAPASAPAKATAAAKSEEMNREPMTAEPNTTSSLDQLDSTSLARSSADALFRRQEDPSEEAELSFDDEIRQLNEKLFGAAAPQGGGMGGGAGAESMPVVDNPFQSVVDSPRSVFSIQTPTNSYRLVRDTLMRSAALPSPGSIRIEEMLNYFPYTYGTPLPNAKHPFAAAFALSQCPWNTENLLARVALHAKDPMPAKRLPCNLVFMIDTSGSMDAPDKTPVFAQAFRDLTKQLNGRDRIAVIAFADASGIVSDSTPAKNKVQTNKSLSKLSKGGSTEHGEGLELALHITRENFIDDGINRVIVCTDGDLGNAKQLRKKITNAAETEVSVTVLGFDPSKLAAIKEHLGLVSSHIDFALIDSRAEAKKQLSLQIKPRPETVAKEVSLQVEFNPARVKEYRLIGYENHPSSESDPQADDYQADQFLQGQTVTALYEIVPSESDSDRKDWLTVKLNYKRSDAATSQTPSPSPGQLITFPLDQEPADFETMDPDFRFAAAVAGLGMTLRGSEHRGDWTLKDIQSVARKSLGPDPFGIRKEFLQITETANRFIQKEGQ